MSKSASAVAASSIASAVGVGIVSTPGRRRDGEVRREQDDVGAAPARLLGEGDAHAAGGAVADEAGRVERLARAAGGDEHALAREAARARGAARPGGRSPRARPSGRRPTRPRPSRPRRGRRARRRGRRSVSAFARVAGCAPHARVHRGRDEHGPAVGERRLGEEVVGEPVRELRERVRGARRDDEQVGAGQVGVEVLARAGRRASAANVSRADEALRARA